MVYEHSARTEQSMRLLLSGRQRDADIVHDFSGIIKVILEKDYPSREQEVTACQIAKQAGANSANTSTGSALSSAAEADVRLRYKTARRSMGIKAAGCMPPLGKDLEMPAPGINRLGTDVPVASLEETDPCVG